MDGHGNGAAHAARPVSLLGLATAVPPHVLEQSAVAQAARAIYGRSMVRHPKLADVFLNAGIERRYSFGAPARMVPGAA
jgi:alkylresorcinol/alkylpyrone synthase